jgi:hypothetical protein
VRGEQRRRQAEDVDQGEREADQPIVPKRIEARRDDGRPVDDHGLIGVLGAGQVDDAVLGIADHL